MTSEAASNGVTNTAKARRPGRPAYDLADRSAAAQFEAIRRDIRLDKASKRPLWRQISEALEAAVRGGGLAPRSRLPSEEALAAMFGVSRPVVRNALQALAGRGLVVKLHRKGIFVGDPPPETGFITTNLAAYDDLVARGHKVTTRTFELYRSAPDPEERAALQLDDGDTVVRIGRVFFMDGKPITHARISFHGAKVPGFENEDMEGRPILRHIQERYGRSLSRAERWFKAVMPPADVADAMDLGPDTPVIWIESIAYEADNTPLEYYRAHYNSETAVVHLSVIG